MKEQEEPLTLRDLLPPAWIVALGGIVAFVALIFALKELVVLLVVGYALAYLVDPVLSWGEKKGIPRSRGGMLVGVLIVLLFALVCWFAIPPLVAQYVSLSENFPRYVQRIQESIRGFAISYGNVMPRKVALFLSTFSFDKAMSLASDQSIARLTSGLQAALLQGYSLTLTVLNLLLLPLIAYYIAVEFDAYHRSVLLLLPRRYRPAVLSTAREIDSYIRGFVRGQLLVGALLSLLYSIGLGIVGIDLWFLVALISGFGNLVPYLGFVTGVVLASLMAIITFHDFSHLVWVWIVYGIVQFLESFIISPKIVGDAVGLSPLGVILAVLAGGKLFGILGVFLAIPMVAFLRVLGERVRKQIVASLGEDDD